MSDPNPTSRQRFGLLFAGSLLAIAAVVSYFSIVPTWLLSPRQHEKASPDAVAYAEEVVLPPGPHRAQFQTACLTCHSPRLAFNQPTFPEAKWTEIVQKMITVYGAPISKTEEQMIVEYLMAAQAAR